MINRPPARPYRAFFCPARFAGSAVNNQDRILYLFQGDYIRYPALYELSSKYGVAGNDQVPLPARLDVLREHIRREIRKVCRVSLIPRRLQLLRSCLFLRLCTHGSTVSTLRLLRYLETLSCSLSLSSDNQPNASLFFFLFISTHRN